MPVARAQVEPTLEGARRAIEQFQAQGDSVVAIGNEFKHADVFMNLLRRYASMEGSKGAKWDKRVPLVGLTYFPKWASSAFVNPGFEVWLRRESIREIALDPGLRSLDTRLGIHQFFQRFMEGQIPGVCLCRDGGPGRLSDGQQSLWYWNP
jgi:hypothetical protein